MKPWEWVLASIVVVAGVIAAGFLLYKAGYQYGYCAAAGGERLTDSVCAVDGRVVEIR